MTVTFHQYQSLITVVAPIHSSCNSMLPLRHQAWKEVGLVIPQGTLPGAHCDRGGPPTWVGRLALTGHPASAGEQPQLRPTRSDGSPCTAGVAQHLHDWPELTGHLPLQGSNHNYDPPARMGRPALQGLHNTHVPAHREGTSLLCRGHARNTCSPTPTKGGRPCYTGAMHAYHGRSACMQGQTIIIYLSGRAAHAHTSYNPPPTSYIAYNPSQ